MGAQTSRAGDYDEPDLPDGVMEVRVSVYTLGLTGLGMFDRIGASVAGAYHSGVVVDGGEWAYGGHDEDSKSGVYRCSPEQNTDFQFHSRVVIGRLRATPQQLMQKIREIGSAPQWAGPQYDLIEHNCNHFASDLCWLLLRRRPPLWINGTAETMARRRRRKRLEQEALRLALASYRSRCAGMRINGLEGQPQKDVPGAGAFEDAFTSTFELACQQDRVKQLGEDEDDPNWDLEEVMDIAAPPKQVSDPKEEMRAHEKAVLGAALQSARSAANAVAAAARLAAASRAAQPHAGLAAWDAAWKRESAPLLKGWREDAVEGNLVVAPEENFQLSNPRGVGAQAALGRYNPQGSLHCQSAMDAHAAARAAEAAQKTRDQLVQAALSIATAEAQEACERSGSDG
eukprot:TRINITY_DN4570_c0_g1_i1.p1 TRINITY_DN4570_c0_g1~~TRINITY_DN4570_c0_g1_i1.p1  ORF type:complete len:400 (-),score=91.24 TRINITY_DN4570_c0_g1_i1:628-1827(-)